MEGNKVLDDWHAAGAWVEQRELIWFSPRIDLIFPTTTLTQYFKG